MKQAPPTLSRRDVIGLNLGLVCANLIWSCLHVILSIPLRRGADPGACMERTQARERSSSLQRQAADQACLCTRVTPAQAYCVFIERLWALWPSLALRSTRRGGAGGSERPVTCAAADCTLQCSGTDIRRFASFVLTWPRRRPLALLLVPPALRSSRPPLTRKLIFLFTVAGAIFATMRWSLILGLRDAGPDIAAAVTPATPVVTLVSSVLLGTDVLNLRTRHGRVQVLGLVLCSSSAAVRFALYSSPFAPPACLGFLVPAAKTGGAKGRPKVAAKAEPHRPFLRDRRWLFLRGPCYLACLLKGNSRPSTCPRCAI